MRIHVRALLAVVLVVALSTVSAQNDGSAFVESPGIAVLVHHPYPDASDPFGFEYLATGNDPYWHRYQHLDTDEVPGFDFPHTVFDGIVPIEGIPEGEGPYVSTRDAYQAAFAQRSRLDAPIELSVGLFGGDANAWNVAWFADVQADLSGEDLHVWVAVVEDPVHYEPPPALSNGVFVHPFVVRGITQAGLLDGAPQNVAVQRPSGNGPEVDSEHLRAVVWVQQGASDGLRFDAHEVVQAAMEVPGEGQTLATEKVVLMEMYSATWCDTCLFGDRVAEELAVEHGVQRDLEEASAGYLRDGPWILALIGGLVAAVLVAWPRLDGGRQ